LPITYDPPSDTITVTGYTSAVPCTLADIQAANDAGGWGRVTTLGNYTLIYANLTVGTGTETHFADTNKIMQVGTSSAPKNLIINVTNTGEFRLGALSATGDPQDGCLLKTYPAAEVGWWGAIKFYGSVLMLGLSGVDTDINGVVTIKACIINQTGRRTYFSPSCSGAVYKLYVLGDNQTFLLYTANVTWSDILIFRPNAILFGSGINPTLKDVVIENPVSRSESSVANAYLINCTASESGFWQRWWTSSESNKVYRQYTLDLKYTKDDGTPIQAALVEIFDKNNNLVASSSTDANGDIIQQILTSADYAGGTPTVTDYNPFTVKITKTDYETVEFKLNIYEKKKLVVALSKPYDIKAAIEKHDRKITGLVT